MCVEILGNLEAKSFQWGYIKIYSEVHGAIFALGSGTHGQNVVNGNTRYSYECFFVVFLLVHYIEEDVLVEKMRSYNVSYLLHLQRCTQEITLL